MKIETLIIIYAEITNYQSIDRGNYVIRGLDKYYFGIENNENYRAKLVATAAHLDRMRICIYIFGAFEPNKHLKTTKTKSQHKTEINTIHLTISLLFIRSLLSGVAST